ncbi:MAG TPA: glycosyltransferase family A protein [Candidatus Dormibacteraeota bacterium]|nr:glycosyltransferase family A protein [Candidatus Dormibacteraeota bacterium]
MSRAAHARSPDTASAEIKVSLVVPVYNPGRHINGLLRSLGRQTLPADQFEVIFVDDESTDGTADRLEALAAHRQNFRVIRIPHSGWPGRPRNVGVDAARGEYVLFVDNDDLLGAEALHRLTDYASANNSDIVVGKEVRRNLHVSSAGLFSVNRPNATLEDDPLLELLTPHKMFRRSFLVENGLRYLEGPRRLEDHPFVAKAYFRANVISVLSDYPCYYWVTRRDRSNAGLRPCDWAEWYGFMRDALDVVEEHTEPGPMRDRLLAHWYRSKGLRQIPRAVSTDGANGRGQLEALAKLAAERFPPSVDHYLPAAPRVRSHLLRTGEFELLTCLARAEYPMRLEHQLTRVRGMDGELEFQARAHLTYVNGSPVRVERRDGRDYWIPPVELGDAVPAELLDFTEGASRPTVDLTVRRNRTHQVFALPREVEPFEPDADGTARLGGVCTARLNPATLQAGRPLSGGIWGLRVQVNACGWFVHDAVSAAHASRRDWPFNALLGNPRAVVPYPNRRGTVSIDVFKPRGRLARTRVPALWRRLRHVPAVDSAIGLLPRRARAS